MRQLFMAVPQMGDYGSIYMSARLRLIALQY
jgi:hypothetical protein